MTYNINTYRLTFDKKYGVINIATPELYSFYVRYQWKRSVESGERSAPTCAPGPEAGAPGVRESPGATRKGAGGREGGAS